MKTEKYPYKLAAVYPDIEAANAAVKELNSLGLENIRITQLAPGASDVERTIEDETEAVRDTMIKDTASGSAIGAASGGAVAGAAAVVAPTLFVSAPVVAPLLALGYGAIVGGTVGALRGFDLSEGELVGLVNDTLKAGHHVVIVHAEDDDAKQRAQALIDETMVEKTANA